MDNGRILSIFRWILATPAADIRVLYSDKANPTRLKVHFRFRPFSDEVDCKSHLISL